MNKKIRAADRDTDLFVLFYFVLKFVHERIDEIYHRRKTFEYEQDGKFEISERHVMIAIDIVYRFSFAVGKGHESAALQKRCQSVEFFSRERYAGFVNVDLYYREIKKRQKYRQKIERIGKRYKIFTEKTR